VLALFSDPSVGMSSVLAWDVREVGCFSGEGGSAARRSKARPTASPSPQIAAACREHQLVIITAGTGRLLETIDY
jgi:hypothetical protein